MKFLKTTITSLILLSSLASAVPFEQQGVKEGNDRVSIGLISTIHNEDGSDEMATIYGQYGRFITDNIEIGAYIFTLLNNGDVTYQVAPGINYYFLKTPTLTPYVGAQYYYTDTTREAFREDGSEIDFSSNGGNLHFGFHKFFNENISITPEVGARFVDFTEYTDTYLNIYLTYFFN
jgi:outer membrane protein W